MPWIKPNAESGNTRWGSGEGRITNVELLDDSGASRTRFRTGDPVTMRLHYEMEKPIERPVFGLAIHTLDGTHVTGPNTRDADVIPDKLEGKGHVDLRIDRLLLVPGTYDITVSLYDYGVLHPFDFRHKVARFDVEHGTPRESYGVISLDGHWTIDKPHVGM